MISRSVSFLVVALSFLAGCQFELRAVVPAMGEFDEFVEKWMVDSKVSGVSVGLIKENALALAKGYGLANRETKLIPTADTVWSMASCSKPVVGIAALKLVDQGKLDLDKDISGYLGFALRNPNFPAEKITLRHLLAHASSLRDASEAGVDSYPRPDPPQQLEKDVRTWLLPEGAEFADGAYWDASGKPGTKYAYSNVGTTLAALVVEKVSGQLFNEFCNQHLFAPLGLASTRWFFRELPDATQAAIPYDENFRPYGHYGFAEYPSGQLRSSVTEFSKLILMLMNQGEWAGRRILSGAAVAEMQRVQFPALDPEGGLLLGVGETANGVRQFYHQGAESGVGTYFLFQPDKTGALFMSNGSLRNSAYDSLMKRLLEEIPKLPAVIPPDTVPPKLSARIVAGGKIALSWPASASDFDLEANTTLLSAGWTAIPANQVVTEGGNRVFTESPGGDARFYRLRKN